MVHIYYGSGKGKTTAAMGMVLRALNYNLKIAVIKFFKPRYISGEDRLLEKYKNVKLIFSKYSHPEFMKNTQPNKEKVFQHQYLLFKKAKEIIQKDYDIIVLDEILGLIKPGIITTKDIIELIKLKKENIELVLTGHFINKSLIKHADLVTEMKKIKHYYDKDSQAKKGIEF